MWPGRAERADPATILRLNPNADDPKRWTRPFAMATDLDIDHALMVENLLDPAHLPFTHEGTLSKRANAKPLRMDVDVVEVDWCSPESGDVKGEVDDKGVIVDKNVVDDTKNVLKKHGVKVLRGNSHFSTDDKSQGYFHFIPPCHVVLRHTFANGYKCKSGCAAACIECAGFNLHETSFSFHEIVHQTMHCVPTRPGHMRLIYMQSRDFMTFVNVLERLPLIRDYVYNFALKVCR